MGRVMDLGRMMDWGRDWGRMNLTRIKIVMKRTIRSEEAERWKLRFVEIVQMMKGMNCRMLRGRLRNVQCNLGDMDIYVLVKQ